MLQYILFAIPFFLLMMGLEIWYAHKKQKQFYRFNDTIANLSIGIGYEAIGLFMKMALFGAYIYVYRSFALLHIPATWWSFILVLLLYDLCFYWAHRLLHTVNVFWGAHVVHHSSEEYNLSVALRQSWFESALGFFIFLPIPLLGFDPIVFVPAAALDSLYQFWIHTRTIHKMPKWWEAILNTPSHHRVHHARNAEYIDKNYGGIFIIWDKLFGTFQPEENPCIYGITKPLNSWNPLKANSHYYSYLAGTIKKIKSPLNKLKLLFAKPGWIPDEIRNVQPEQKLHAFQYDAKSSPWMHAYVFMQMVIIIAGLIVFMYNFDAIGIVYQMLIFILIILSIVICTGILENKSGMIRLEYFKLALLLFILNSYYYLHAMNWFMITLVISGIVYIFLNVLFTITWKRSVKL